MSYQAPILYDGFRIRWTVVTRLRRRPTMTLQLSSSRSPQTLLAWVNKSTKPDTSYTFNTMDCLTTVEFYNDAERTLDEWAALGEVL